MATDLTRSPARWLTVACVLTLLAGCERGVEQPAQRAETVAQPSLTARQMQQWASSCALCHASGVAGAPVVGNLEHWQPRLGPG